MQKFLTTSVVWRVQTTCKKICLIRNNDWIPFRFSLIWKCSMVSKDIIKKKVQYLITSNKHQYIQDGAVHLIMSLKLQVRRMQPLPVVSDVRIWYQDLTFQQTLAFLLILVTAVPGNYIIIKFQVVLFKKKRCLNLQCVYGEYVCHSTTRIFH